MLDFAVLTLECFVESKIMVSSVYKRTISNEIVEKELVSKIESLGILLFVFSTNLVLIKLKPFFVN